MSIVLNSGAIIDKTIKLALIQDQPGSGIREPFYQALREFRPEIIAFPEYYFVGPEFGNIPDSYLKAGEAKIQMRDWSKEFDCVIVGGTVVEKTKGGIYNRCYLFDHGEIIGHYDKIHLYPGEGQGMLTAGIEFRVFDIAGIRLGILICADVLYPDSFRNIRGLRPEMIIIPTTSRLRPGEPVQEKFKRDNEIFAVGAFLADCPVIKVSASGILTGRGLQGRSLIASPGQVLWRIEPENEDKAALIRGTFKPDRPHTLLDIIVHRP